MTGIDTDVREVQKMFNVNVFGPMRMVHEFHPMLINAKGAIVNIGSVGGIVPYIYGCKWAICTIQYSRMSSPLKRPKTRLTRNVDYSLIQRY